MINFAIVGCGHIATKHGEAIAATEGGALYAYCDVNRDNLERFGVKHKGRAFDNFDELLEVPEIHVVNICTPSGLHAPLAIRAAKAGKHVIVEKPIALRMEDAKAMIAACRDHGVKLAVVHPNRYRPAIRELKKALDSGRFGKISHVNATVRWNRSQAYYDQAEWRGTKEQDGGVLMNQAIHNLDLLQWLIGPTQEVRSFTSTRLRSMEAEDVAVAALRFENGALGVIEAASTIYPQNFEESISIFGEKGSAIIGGPTANWVKHWAFADGSNGEGEQLKRLIEKDPFGTPGHTHIIRDMVEAIRQNRDPEVTGEDGRKALELVLSVYEAAGGSRLHAFSNVFLDRLAIPNQ